MKEYTVPVQLIYPEINISEITLIPFHPQVLYRRADAHAASDAEAAIYIDEINAFLSNLFQSPLFLEFFVDNHCALTIEQLSDFIKRNSLGLIVPDTSKYYCYKQTGSCIFNHSWLYDSRVAPIFQFSFDGFSYHLTAQEKVYLNYYMNCQLVEQGGEAKWFVDDEESGFGSLVCEASKYLVPEFYQFFKKTNGADSYYLSEYDISFGDCPGLIEAITEIREQLTRVTFCLSSQTPYDYGDSTLIYTSYGEVREIIKKKRKAFKRASESC